MSSGYIVRGTRTVLERDEYSQETDALAEACRWSADGLTTVEVVEPSGVIWSIHASHYMVKE